MRWVATLLLAGCRFGDALPVPPPQDAVGTELTPPDGPTCAPGYTATGGHFYMLLGANNWTAQRAACQATSLRADLAFPEDAATLQLLSEFVGVGHDYWIGITDEMMLGAFVTVRGAPATFLPWDVNEPTDSALETCVRVVSSGSQHLFADDKCDFKLAAVCECVVMQ